MKYSITLVLCLFFTTVFAQEKLDYYLPEGVSYNPDIPTPEEVIGHQIGEFHITSPTNQNKLEELRTDHLNSIEPSHNPYGNPVYFTDNPLQSGYINDENLEMLKGSVSVMTHSYGPGNVITFFDDPAFRGYFAGLHKLFMNAILFSGVM